MSALKDYVLWIAAPPKYGLVRWLRSRKGWRKFRKQPFWKSARLIARAKGLK